MIYYKLYFSPILQNVFNKNERKKKKIEIDKKKVMNNRTGEVIKISSCILYVYLYTFIHYLPFTIKLSIQRVFNQSIKYV